MERLIYPVGSTSACSSAAAVLRKSGLPLVDHPSPDVTHLLLDVPSFSRDGMLRGGGRITDILERLPASITIIGGNLNTTSLSGYPTFDLLKDEQYLCLNAAITADCAIRTAASHLETTFADSPVLILGWGRIAKCLAFMLRGLGASITIGARKETDRGMIRSLGFQAADLTQAKKLLPQFRLLYNTIPFLILTQEDLKYCRRCVKIDLASTAGMEGSDVIQARGLPGLLTPESSGKLIADTVLSKIQEGLL